MEDLLDEGFFREPLKTDDVYERVSKRGIVISSRVKTQIFDKLRGLVKAKKLAKFKQGMGFVYQER